MQHFIAISGIEHENFGVDRIQLKFFRQFVSPVFEKVLRQTHALLPSFGLRIQPSLQFRFFACRMFDQRVEAIVSGNSQRVNRNRVSLVEPKPNCAFKLRFGGGNLSDEQRLDTFRHRFGFWGAQRAAIFAILLAVSPHTLPAAAAFYSQDFLRNACSRERGTAILFRSEAPAFAIHEATLCNLDRNSPASSCASKLLDLLRNLQTDREMLLLSERLSVRGEHDGDKTRKLSEGLFLAIIGSISTAVLIRRAQVRYASKTGRRPHELSVRESIRLLPEPMLLGLALTIALVILEVSLRHFLK